MRDYDEIKKECRIELMDRLDYTRDISDEEIMELIDDRIDRIAKMEGISLKERIRLRDELFASIRKMDVLERFIKDPSVTEIMVNGPSSIFVERAGKLLKEEVRFESEEKLADVIQQIVARVNRVVNKEQKSYLRY